MPIAPRNVHAAKPLHYSTVRVRRNVKNDKDLPEDGSAQALASRHVRSYATDTLSTAGQFAGASLVP